MRHEKPAAVTFSGAVTVVTFPFVALTVNSASSCLDIASGSFSTVVTSACMRRPTPFTANTAMSA